jgi:uncharacterized membrane protein
MFGKKDKKVNEKLPLIVTAGLFAFNSITNFTEFNNYLVGALFLVVTIVSIVLIRFLEHVPAVIHLVFNLFIAASCFTTALQYKTEGSKRMPAIYYGLTAAYVILAIFLYRKKKAEVESK